MSNKKKNNQKVNPADVTFKKVVDLISPEVDKCKKRGALVVYVDEEAGDGNVSLNAFKGGDPEIVSQTLFKVMTADKRFRKLIFDAMQKYEFASFVASAKKFFRNK